MLCLFLSWNGKWQRLICSFISLFSICKTYLNKKTLQVNQIQQNSTLVKLNFATFDIF